jgi:CrcB protein
VSSTARPTTRPTPRPTPAVLAVVALGGALGATLRYSLDTWLPVGTGAFPTTTFAINVVGSFMLALLPAVALVRRSHLLPPLLGPGLLGGFTTLSAVSEQTRALLADDRVALAATYSLATLLACLLVVALADRLSTPLARVEFDVEEGDR